MNSLLKTGRLYLPMLLSTAAVSLIAFFVCASIERNAAKYWHFFMTGGFFALFCLMLCAAVFLCEYFFEGFPEAAIRGKMKNLKTRNYFALTVAGMTLASFLVGGFFQFLYELEPTGKTREAAAYAFIIDNSISMGGNDPSNMRFDALTQICESLPPEKPVAVYVFGTDTFCVRPYATQEDQPVSPTDQWFTDLENTYLGKAIMQCCEDTDMAKSEGLYSGMTRIITLTDGDSADLGWFSADTMRKVVNRACDGDCEIFSIGFGDADRSTLENLSWETNGEYYDAGDAYNIASSMNSAVAAKSRGRMLMGVRSGKKSTNIWYGLMRVFFVALLSFGISCGSALLIDYKNITMLIISQTAVKSLLAAILLELLIQHSFGSGFVQLTTCLLIGTLVLMVSNSKFFGFYSYRDVTTHDKPEYNVSSVITDSDTVSTDDLSVSR